MKWKEIPKDARSYILYHSMNSPTLIAIYLLPLYMLTTGYSILSIGILYTGVSLAGAVLTYLIGKIFNRFPLKNGLIAIEGLEGVLSRIFYFLSVGPVAPIMIFAGKLSEKGASTFYPLFQAYEKAIYPEEKREEIYAWHMRLPEISQLIFFPLLGYVLGRIFNTPGDWRMAFLILGLASLPIILWIWKSLPRIGEKKRLESDFEPISLGREFGWVVGIELLSYLATALVPAIVLVNYVFRTMGGGIFEIMVVEAGISIGSIAASYISERIEKKHGFKVMSFGTVLTLIWAGIMFIGPSFPVVIAAYIVQEFGHTLKFPFYRSWIFKNVPSDRSSEIFGGISSVKKVLGIFTPLIAGFLASRSSVLPYGVSFILLGLLCISYFYVERFSKYSRS